MYVCVCIIHIYYTHVFIIHCICVLMTEGRIHLEIEPRSFVELRVLLPDIQMGGKWRPSGNCTVQQRLAILIPYRDRDAHLRVLLLHLHRLLQKQMTDYCIFVVEPVSCLV
jgi:hypothetical protein